MSGFDQHEGNVALGRQSREVGNRHSRPSVIWRLEDPCYGWSTGVTKLLDEMEGAKILVESTSSLVCPKVGGQGNSLRAHFFQSANEQEG